jgi:hypothetical protein
MDNQVQEIDQRLKNLENLHRFAILIIIGVLLSILSYSFLKKYAR